MKTNKRTLAILTAGLLTVTPLTAAGMTVFAANSTNLTVVDTDTTNHTYKAYQLLTGTTDENGKLKSLAMGDGISQANLIAAVNATLGGTPLDASATVDEIAVQLAVIAGSADDSAALAKEIAKYKVTDKGTALTREANTNNYTNSSMTNGWYLIIDETSLAAATTDKPAQVRSANILQLTQDTTINTKHSLPTLDKVIIDSGEKEVNTASIGDVITYNIKTKVPDMTGYDKYYFVVDDTLSKGLTYNDDLTVKYGPSTGTALTLDSDGAATANTGDFYVTKSDYNDTTGTTIKVVFENFYTKFKAITPGTDIIISYSATLNNNAVIDDNTNGNPNTAKLTYSNDPNVSTDGTNETGKPDEPGTGAPTGETPPDTVKTFTTSIIINKHELGNDSILLQGVKFRLTGTGFNSVLNETGLYVKDAGGTYYLLNDGTYTEEEPNGNSTHDAVYASKTEKYTYTPTANITGNPVKVTAYGETDADGRLTFSGLNAGTYTITEYETKDGYNLLTDPITLTITATPNETTKTCSWEYTSNKDITGQLLDIANAMGATLPTTGGIGTKLFYIIGSLLVSGSVVLLVTKKRMGAKED